jgi:FixJ family two-component response regulator
MASRALIAVVDDDESVRESLPDLLEQLGYAVRAFASAEELLVSDCLPTTECLILDINMPRMSGPELQQQLYRAGYKFPIIFITAQVNKDLRGALIQRGAAECLYKPFDEQHLQAALDAAFSRK